jgi:hypothetical protein
LEKFVAKEEEVKKFLENFHQKTRIFDIVFRNDRNKNIDTLFKLEISSIKRKEIIDSLITEDYSEGPLPDTLHHISDLWVFGKTFRKQEIYIKINMGYPDSSTICISFHIAEKRMLYPLKK